MRLIAAIALIFQLGVTIADTGVEAKATESNVYSEEIDLKKEEDYPVMDDEPSQEEIKRLREESMTLEELKEYTSAPANENLPSSIDNSKNKYFPASVNQTGNTCWAYSTVYYQATYEYNRTNDIAYNGKNALSPIFVHNITTSNKDSSGSAVFQSYRVLKEIGAATEENVPINHDGTSNYFMNWHPTEKVWKDAIKHRFVGYYDYNMSANITEGELTNIKGALNEGAVLSLTTDIFYVDVPEHEVVIKECDNPDISNTKYVGDLISYASRKEMERDDDGNLVEADGGCHQVTIVGYDDDIWVDINGDNVVDADEKGAFKIMNSWGDAHNRKPYLWVSYDAFRKDSKVLQPKSNYVTRTASPCGLATRLIYSKDLLNNNIYLKVKLNTSCRNDIDIKVSCEGKEFTFRRPDGNWYGRDFTYLTQEDQMYDRKTYYNYSMYGNENIAEDGTLLIPLDNVFVADERNIDNIKCLTSKDLLDKDWKITISDNTKNNQQIKLKEAQIIDENSGLKVDRFNIDTDNTIDISESNQVVLDGNSISLSPVIDADIMSYSIISDIGIVGAVTTLDVKLSDELKNSKCNLVAEGGNYEDGIGVKNFKMTSLSAGTWIPDKDGVYKIYADIITDGKTTRHYLCDYNVKNKNYSKVIIYYKGVSNAHIHYQIGDGAWTKSPGYEMEKNTDVAGCEYLYTVELCDETKLKACFNDGANRWDNNGSKNYSFEAGKYYSVINGVVKEISEPVKPIEVTSLSSNYPKGITGIRTVKFKAVSNNVQGTAKYTFIDIAEDGTQNVIVSNTTNPIVSWKPTSYGNHTIKVKVVDDKNSAEKMMEMPVRKGIKVKFTGDSKVYLGDTAQYTATASGGTGDYKYTFFTYKNNFSTEKIILQTGSCNTFNWKLDNLGVNVIYLRISDEGGSAVTGSKSVKVIEKPLQITSITFNDETVTNNTNLFMDCDKTANIKVNVTGGKGGYTFSVYAVSGNDQIEEIISKSSSHGTWNPKDVGGYTIFVKVKDSADVVVSKTFTVDVIEQNKTVIYYKGFSNPYIHYKIGSGSWTTAPGEKMTACTDIEGYQYKAEINLGGSTELTACFNDGKNNWDSDNGKNYKFARGYYTYSKGVITKINKPKKLEISSLTGENVSIDEINKVITFYLNQEGKVKLNAIGGSGSYKYTSSFLYENEKSEENNSNEIVYTPRQGDENISRLLQLEVCDSSGNCVSRMYEVKVAEKPSNTITIYYNSSFVSTSIYYKIGNRPCTVAPGVKMTTTIEKPGFNNKIVIDLGSDSTLMARFNNGKNTWDKCKCYKFTSNGVYTCFNGQINKIQ